ncbi:MAG: phosphoglycerate kinase [Clostridia bacterium]|nr:phosphoglycerate kinase [Clostridia bacterium]
MKKTLNDIDVNGKRVLLRVDFNVPLSADLKIVDDNRIIEALPTIEYLVSHNAKVIICSHLGRPEGVVNPKMSLRPVVSRLGKLLQKDIVFVEDIKDESCTKVLSSLKDGDIAMLENIRFYKEEENNDKDFAKLLASFADVYVFDAFATAHRKHASTYAVAEMLPNAVGFLVEKELEMFEKVLSEPEHPFVAVLGGAKITDKLPVIENLLDKVDTILIGGGMSYTFVKAIGGDVGKSIIDNKSIDLAKETLDKAKEKGIKVILPCDNYGADEFTATAKRKCFSSGFFAKDFQGMDIGPHTTKTFKNIIKDAKTIVWNGPMGVYEFPKFRRGTKKIAKYIAKSKAVSVIGGGDTVASVQELGLENKITHISTGGGASLMLLQGKKLPCVEIIENK